MANAHADVKVPTKESQSGHFAWLNQPGLGTHALLQIWLIP